MTPQTFLEQNFEEHIAEHLLGSGYTKHKPTDYDKDLCLIAEETNFDTFTHASTKQEESSVVIHYGFLV